MSTSTPRVSLVALSEPLLPSIEAVAEQLIERFPDAPPLALTSESGSGVTFRLGVAGGPQATGNYTLVDKPIPWEQIEGPCTLAWYWPDAADVMRHHGQHLFLTLVDESKDPIERMIHLTQLTVAIAATTPSAGLVWAPNVTVHNPVDFAQMAAKMTRDDLPLQLWVDFRISQRDDGGLMLFTTGMESLGHREFEVERFSGEPTILTNAVYNIAHYVLGSAPGGGRPILKDGEAIGLPDGAQMNVEVAPSMIDANLEVVRLKFE
ncbi:MAG: DUF4261 domain-containing protein [Planctomycetota bacterium]